MQERLLNAYLAGTIDEKALATKQTQLRDESATVATTVSAMLAAARSGRIAADTQTKVSAIGMRLERWSVAGGAPSLEGPFWAALRARHPSASNAAGSKNGAISSARRGAH